MKRWRQTMFGKEKKPKTYYLTDEGFKIFPEKRPRVYAKSKYHATEQPSQIKK